MCVWGFYFLLFLYLLLLAGLLLLLNLLLCFLPFLDLVVFRLLYLLVLDLGLDLPRLPPLGGLL